MSFAEIIEELPHLTPRQRQELLREVMVMEDQALSEADEALVAQRLTQLRARPGSVLSIHDLRANLSARRTK